MRDFRFYFSLALSNTLLIKGICLLCSAKAKAVWCKDCEKDMPVEVSRCPVCAIPSAGGKKCRDCLDRKPIIEKTCVAFNYDYPVNLLIQRFKYNGHPEFAITFAQIMTDKLSNMIDKPDAIIPVPLHKKKQVKRGFNQSLVLARYIGKAIGTNVETALCSKIVDTPPQSALSVSERKKNIRGAFRLTSRAIPKHIAIVDDVITSGSTTIELATLFKKAGCERIDIWAIARAT